MSTDLLVACQPGLSPNMEGHAGESQKSSLAPDKSGLEKTRSSVPVPVYNDLESVDETDLSLAAILKGTAANPLNTFEKKAALVNVELDKFGLGRYQLCIWFLCGFGYFLDLAWSQGVGLISSAIYQEMGVADKDTGAIFAIANAGLALGALLFGLMVDVIGRKLAFNLTCLITSIFGLLLVRACMHKLSKFDYLSYLGCSKVQLRCHLWHLLSCILGLGRKHSNRCNDCSRVPATQPQVLGRALIHVAASWGGHCIRHIVRDGRKVALRPQVAVVQSRWCQRGMLHGFQQYGLALQCHRAWVYDIGRFFPSIFCVHLPRIPKVSA